MIPFAIPGKILGHILEMAKVKFKEKKTKKAEITKLR